MSTAIHPTHRNVVTLNLPLPVPTLITYVQSIAKAMTDNPHFPSPTPPLTQVSTAIAALVTAQTATLSRTKGAVATRNSARATLHTMLQQLKGYVQTVADANPDTSEEIIQSAGMAVRKVPVRPPRVFNATPGPVAGSVKIVTSSAARRASYEWEYSLDGGKTWVAAPPSLQAKTIVTGLPSGTSVLFRGRAVTKSGPGDWGLTVPLNVK